MTGTPALDWLFGLQRFGMRPGLERARALLVATGLPAPGTRVVLVAGTNGKGTVTRLVASALTAAGHRTGSFFSPHLERVGERARVDGAEATDEEMEAAVAAVRPAAERLGCTFFEVVTAAALHRFGAAAAKWAVMEVGLGGRFDATNALEPELSVVTGVALDHQAVLGDTVAAIAREKAGVLRPGRLAVTGARGEALDVVAAEATAVGAPLLALGRDFDVTVAAAGWDGLALTVEGDLPGLPLALRSPLVGRHQARNVAVAAATALALGVAPEVVQTAFARTAWPGRLERLDLDRAWVLDGAHNPEAAEALAAALDDLGAPVGALVVGVSADNDLLGVLRPLARVARTVVATRSSPRGAPQGAVAAAARRAGAAAVREAPDAAAALRLARQFTRAGEAVLVAGSLFLVGEARSLLLGAAPEGRERWQ
ncbi:MAG TPA: Mur ligase family protein [Trueperaceae bacterium]|nr:Mur ligase family protein [Trueperaceae bacterium]